MTVESWSGVRLVLSILGWLLGFPLLLLALAVFGAGNLGFTLPVLVIVLGFWMGPAIWLLRRWRAGRGRRVAGDAA
jgi:hypothetical protein